MLYLLKLYQKQKNIKKLRLKIVGRLKVVGGQKYKYSECPNTENIKKPDKFVFRFRMVQYLLGCPVPAEIDNLNIVLVRYSDNHCS